MQNDFIPQVLQVDFERFLAELEQLDQQVPIHCPYCENDSFIKARKAPLSLRCKGCLKYFNSLTGTPFNRLQPVAWLPIILCERVNRKTYYEIADTLGCDIKKIMRRDKAIKQQMQIDFPDLYQWYCAHNDVANQFEANQVSDAIDAQHSAFKQKLSEILATTHSPCWYCDSSNTVKIGERATFRCNHCRRNFSLLQDTPIFQLPRIHHWLAYLDLLVAKNSNRDIAQKLGMNSNTASIWRQKWCATMQLWGFENLAIWCNRR
ncbi:hypothetical protein PT273_02715 [Orbaceae bacterium ESL0727]|nr:hypothetical protein [Orbaceae bacterium ESL0727]